MNVLDRESCESFELYDKKGCPTVLE